MDICIAAKDKLDGAGTPVHWAKGFIRQGEDPTKDPISNRRLNIFFAFFAPFLAIFPGSPANHPEREGNNPPMIHPPPKNWESFTGHFLVLDPPPGPEAGGEWGPLVQHEQRREKGSSQIPSKWHCPHSATEAQREI